MDIVYDIHVSTMGRGAKKHILYKANISSTQVEYYFSALLAHDLLGKALTSTATTSTARLKGKKFLAVQRGNTVTDRARDKQPQDGPDV